MADCARSQEEIVARIRAIDGQDLFGFRAEVLIPQLDYEHARPFLRSGWTAEEYRAAIVDVGKDGTLEQRAAAYLIFAWGKARDHRGISPRRSVDKLQEYAWLLGRDDVVQAMRQAPYPMYGVPQLVAFAQGIGLQVPDDEMLARMASGQPCRPDCDQGCHL